jgi:hypothetical protein
MLLCANLGCNSLRTGAKMILRIEAVVKVEAHILFAKALPPYVPRFLESLEVSDIDRIISCAYVS